MRNIDRNKITFYRPGSKELVNGEYVSGPPTNLGQVAGSLQPLVQGVRFGEIVKVLPSSLDTSSIKLFITRSTTILRGSNTYEGHQSDYCTLPDGVYSVFQTADWSLSGVQSAHVCYVLVRRPDSTGDLVR